MPQYKGILQIGCFCQYNLRKKVDIFTQCWDYLPVTITTFISVLFSTNLSKYANHSGLFWTTVCGQQNADTWEPIYLKDLWASYRLGENEFTRVTCVICVHARLPTIFLQLSAIFRRCHRIQDASIKQIISPVISRWCTCFSRFYNDGKKEEEADEAMVLVSFQVNKKHRRRKVMWASC